jgi:hypothetical protein
VSLAAAAQRAMTYQVQTTHQALEGVSPKENQTRGRPCPPAANRGQARAWMKRHSAIRAKDAVSGGGTHCEIHVADGHSIPAVDALALGSAGNASLRAGDSPGRRQARQVHEG